MTILFIFIFLFLPEFLFSDLAQGWCVIYHPSSVEVHADRKVGENSQNERDDRNEIENIRGVQRLDRVQNIEG